MSVQALSVNSLVAAALAFGLSAAGPARAQDSFNDKLSARGAAATAPAAAPAIAPITAPAAQPQAPSPTSGRPPVTGRPAGADDESRDLGVKPTTQLRPTEALHGPTPTSIPGGKLVSTQQLAQWLQSTPGRVLLLHAIGSAVHLPQAVAAVPASQGGRYDDAAQRDFGSYLQQATGGDRSRRRAMLRLVQRRAACDPPGLHERALVSGRHGCLGAGGPAVHRRLAPGQRGVSRRAAIRFSMRRRIGCVPARPCRQRNTPTRRSDEQAHLSRRMG